VSKGWWEVITDEWWGELNEVAKEKGFDMDFGQLAMAQFASVPCCMRFSYVFNCSRSAH